MINSDRDLDKRHLDELRRMALLYRRYGFDDKAQECLALALRIEERLAASEKKSVQDGTAEAG